MDDDLIDVTAEEGEISGDDASSAMTLTASEEFPNEEEIEIYLKRKVTKSRSDSLGSGIKHSSPPRSPSPTSPASSSGDSLFAPITTPVTVTAPPPPAKSSSKKKKRMNNEKEGVKEEEGGRGEGSRKKCKGKKKGGQHNYQKKSEVEDEKLENKNKQGPLGVGKEKKGEEVEEEEEEGAKRQCLALECCNAARKGSKYCSQQCCVQLQMDRLKLFMPSRAADWNQLPSVADLKNQKELRGLVTKIKTAKEAVMINEAKRKELEDYILAVEKIAYKDVQKEEEEVQSQPTPSEVDPNKEDQALACVSCGKEVPTNKPFIRHLEACFAKFESLTESVSFRAPFVPPGGSGLPMLCDAYNSRDNTYCKKIKSVCIRHYKGKRVHGWQVCGFPLGKRLDPNGEMCTAPKARCNKHYWWERIQAASIDVERWNSWVKLDDLVMSEYAIRKAMAERGSVMAMMLHTTTSHDPENPPKELTALLEEKMKQKEGDGGDPNSKVE